MIRLVGSSVPEMERRLLSAGRRGMCLVGADDDYDSRGYTEVSLVAWNVASAGYIPERLFALTTHHRDLQEELLNQQIEGRNK